MLLVSDCILAKAVLYLLSEETRHRSLDKMVRACAFFLESEDNNLRLLGTYFVRLFCLFKRPYDATVDSIFERPTNFEGLEGKCHCK